MSLTPIRVPKTGDCASGEASRMRFLGKEDFSISATGFLEAGDQDSIQKVSHRVAVEAGASVMKKLASAFFGMGEVRRIQTFCKKGIFKGIRGNRRDDFSFFFTEKSVLHCHRDFRLGGRVTSWVA